jgi:hypothetical protein
VSAGAAARVVSTPRGRAAVLGGVLVAAALLALAPGSLAPVAARGALAAAVIGAAACLVRRRATPAARPITILAREQLANGAGLALVEAGSRRLLVGFGRDGVRLVAELGPTEARKP